MYSMQFWRKSCVVTRGRWKWLAAVYSSTYTATTTKSWPSSWVSISRSPAPLSTLLWDPIRRTKAPPLRTHPDHPHRRCLTEVPNLYSLKPKYHWPVTSHLDTTRHVRRVEPMHLAVSSLSNSTARHARHDELDWLDMSNVSCRVET